MRLWRGALQQKLTTVCFREDSDEIIAINVLIISTKNDTYKKEIKQQVFSDIAEVVSRLQKFKSKSTHVSEQKQEFCRFFESIRYYV